MGMDPAAEKVTIYHNPRCSKSRQTLELLQERGCEVEVIDYLQSPPSATELESFCRRLGMQPLELMRSKEKRFSELGLSAEDARSNQEWIKVMVQNPILIERPIVVHDGQVALGRPPEKVLKIL
jgi:arsenate reductase